MNRVHNIMGSVFFAIIYCFAIFHFSDSLNFNKNNDTQKTACSSEKQLDLLSVSQSNIGYSFNHLTKETSESKSTSSSPLFLVGTFYFEAHNSSALNHYTNQSKNRVLRYRKSDFIFPFHYHW